MEHRETANTKFYILGLIIYIITLTVNLLNWPVSVLIINTGYLLATILSGYHIIYEGFEDTISSSKANHKFVPNIHLLMALGAIGAILIGSFGEAALLILIFAGAHFLEEYTEGKSQREIKSLLELNPSQARKIMPDGSIVEVGVDEVMVGDHLQVQNGGQVPIDGVIISGTAVIDESTINGESIPREKGVNSDVFAGTINGNSTFTMKATKNASETVFAKILELVTQSQNNLSKTATRIKTLEPKYVTTILLLFPFVILLGLFVFKWSLNVTLYRSIVFLISASPCALAASAVPATLSAISNLAKKGVLFKGGAFLANIAELKTIAFDKTGTLTQGKPQVTDFEMLEQVDPDTLIDIIASMERQTNHPLAAAIVNEFATAKKLDLTVETQMGQGISANYAGSEYVIGKPTRFENIPSTLKHKIAKLGEDGKTVVLVTKDNTIVALIALMDTPNSYAHTAISFFKQQGIHTIMITGDSKQTGEAVAKQIGIDEVVTNVLPEDKVNIIQQQKSQGTMVGMVGDGVNDAPALVNADVGFAMGDGTDVAIDVADVVLMKNDLAKFVYAYKVSQRLNKIVWQNITLSMLIVIGLVIANFAGLTNIGIGVVVHEGSTLLVIFNGLRLLLDTK